MPDAPPTPTAPNYVGAVVTLTLSGILLAALVTLARPDRDNATLVAAILGSTAATTVALMALMQTRATHTAVNSRLDAWIKAAQATSYREGQDEGRAEK